MSKTHFFIQALCDIKKEKARFYPYFQVLSCASVQSMTKGHWIIYKVIQHLQKEILYKSVNTLRHQGKSRDSSIDPTLKWKKKMPLMEEEANTARNPQTEGENSVQWSN